MNVHLVAISSTYLPHVFNLPHAIFKCAINNGNRTQNRKSAQQETDLLVTSMITDRIGRLEFLFSISQNYDKENRHQL